ncbi:hypothetical protein [Ruoffia tabacinasalis]|uniref:DUF4340 domain-containing protein n=1 Tax=Ruoffia tabacinasalis TaxID=87458 RepID=A0ABS0LJ41_9LACT|nr:hypothetical protein [Ruoffia tabacinasalis]MBG9977650.1 hypothetical protein [Ruoffia tabacinasalis]
MKKSLTLLLTTTLLLSLNPVMILAEEDHDHDATETLAADHHHEHGTNYANFMPANILNPDDSVYEAPEATEDYVGLYTAQTRVEDLDADLELILSIGDDGLFNLAYYFVNSPEQRGVRFYANEEGEVESTEAIYQDLVILTGALREGEGGLGTGLIGKTISPVVLLDEDGEADRLYPYMNLAYDLRENHLNARVYQNVGLYLADDVVAVDVNHLIGLDSDEQIVTQFSSVEEGHEDEVLVESRTYELLQESFDNDLIEHNDFKMDYQSENEFMQLVLAMHLRTNASFPQDTEVELIDPKSVQLNDDSEAQYAMLINDSVLYVFDGESLFMTEEVEEVDGKYTVEKWVTN